MYGDGSCANTVACVYGQHTYLSCVSTVARVYGQNTDLSVSQVMAEKPASWKKLSAISQASANPGTMAVKMQRSYHRMDEDETEVDPDDISKGLVGLLFHSYLHHGHLSHPSWSPLMVTPHGHLSHPSWSPSWSPPHGHPSWSPQSPLMVTFMVTPHGHSSWSLLMVTSSWSSPHGHSSWSPPHGHLLMVISSWSLLMVTSSWSPPHGHLPCHDHMSHDQTCALH